MTKYLMLTDYKACANKAWGFKEFEAKDDFAAIKFVAENAEQNAYNTRLFKKSDRTKKAKCYTDRTYAPTGMLMMWPGEWICNDIWSDNITATEWIQGKTEYRWG